MKTSLLFKYVFLEGSQVYGRHFYIELTLVDVEQKGEGLSRNTKLSKMNVMLSCSSGDISDIFVIRFLSSGIIISCLTVNFLYLLTIQSGETSLWTQTACKGWVVNIHDKLKNPWQVFYVIRNQTKLAPLKIHTLNDYPWLQNDNVSVWYTFCHLSMLDSSYQ